MGNLFNGTKVEFNPNNTVKADPFTFQTGEPDIFVGGDIMSGAKFCIDAIAAGREGAISLHRYVHEGQTLTLGRDHNDYHALDKGNFDEAAQDYDTTPRQLAKKQTEAESEKSFKDLRCTFSEEQFKAETGRCLGCGAVEINENMCVGCGICTTKCKFDAISLEKVRDFCGTPYHKTLLGALGTGATRIGGNTIKAVSNVFKVSHDA